MVTIGYKDEKKLSSSFSFSKLELLRLRYLRLL